MSQLVHLNDGSRFPLSPLPSADVGGSADGTAVCFADQQQGLLLDSAPCSPSLDFCDAKLRLVGQRPDVAMLIHLFHRDDDDTWESIWLRDNDKYAIEDYDCLRESAHQLILQLKGHWCDLFIEALRDECSQILEESNKNKESILRATQSTEKTG